MMIENDSRDLQRFYAALSEETWARVWPVNPTIVILDPVKVLTPEEQAALWLASGQAPKGTVRALSQTGIIKAWTSEDDKRVRLLAWKRFHRVR
jgi:hypothetical protein